MPGIINKMDGWKPEDHATTRDLRKEQRDKLRRLIGEGLWEVLGEMTKWKEQKSH